MSLETAEDVFRLPRGWKVMLWSGALFTFLAGALLLFIDPFYGFLTLSQKGSLLLIPLGVALEFLFWFWVATAFLPVPPRVLYIPGIRTIIHGPR